MRTLILMRHAKSSWDTPGLADHDRPLNDRGQRSAQAMGDWLRAEGHLPDKVLCSSSRRTCETFEGLRLDVPIEFSRTLYHAGPAQMMDVLHEADAERVLMLGHNPGIAAFASMLLAVLPHHDRFGGYPTCATLVASFDAPAWNDIGWYEGQPIAFVVPRDIMG